MTRAWTRVGHTSLSNARVWSGERSSCQSNVAPKGIPHLSSDSARGAVRTPGTGGDGSRGHPGVGTVPHGKSTVTFATQISPDTFRRHWCHVALSHIPQVCSLSSCTSTDQLSVCLSNLPPSSDSSISLRHSLAAHTLSSLLSIDFPRMQPCGCPLRRPTACTSHAACFPGFPGVAGNQQAQGRLHRPHVSWVVL